MNEEKLIFLQLMAEHRHGPESKGLDLLNGLYPNFLKQAKDNQMFFYVLAWDIRKQFCFMW
jgi:hypothetical protein